MAEKNKTKAVKAVSLERARKRIEGALAKAGAECSPEEVRRALETVYAAYEANGVQPTREAFAECCKDQEAGRFVKEMEKDPFAADNTKKTALAIVAVVVIAAVACAAAFGLSSRSSAQPEPTPTPSPAAASTQAAASEVDVTVKAEGITADSTKAKAEILDETGESVVSAIEIPANEKTSIGELEPGKYSLRVVQAPVNADGSTYELPENAAEFTVQADGSPVSVEITLEKLAVEDMSREQLEATAKVLEDSGKTNEANAVKAEATDAPSRPGSANDVQAEPTPAPSKPSGGNSGSSSGNSGSKPAHTHNWVEQTKTVHHDAQYKTVHHDAVTKSATICNQCGADITGNVAGHLKDALKNGTGCKNYRNETIVIQEAYDEKVLVKDAWDETVVTGYKCSGCGATK